MTGHATTRPGPPATWATDLAVALPSVAAALSLRRLFTDWSFAPDLVLVVIVAHAVAVATRRRRWPLLVAAPVSVAVGIEVVTFLHLRSTLSFGLPSAETAHRALVELRDAFAPFRDLVAPVPATPGFRIAAAITAWVTASFADAVTNRADAPVQGVTPVVAVFLFTSVLSRGQGAATASVALGASLLLLAVAVRARRAKRRRWARGDGAAGVESDLRRGLAIGAAALTLVLAASPALADRTHGVVDLRRVGSDDGPLVLDSPLVALTALLGERSDAPMFTVRSAEQHYWRLMALERFDGDTWSSDASYDQVDAGDLLPGWNRVPAIDRETHDITIRELRSNWLPAAFEPIGVRIDGELQYQRSTGALFVPEATRPGQRYTVAAELVAVDADEARRRGRTGPRDATRVAPDYLELPSALRRELTRQALPIVAGRTGALDQALALETFFRDSGNGFTYDERADYRGQAEPVLAFLRDRAGFCQQYASTYAALARAIGLPARVAVGFTYGDPGPNSTWTVRGRHAHAWPEVFVEGVGWLPFEPTPGRGNPDASPYDGRAADQADPPVGAGGTAGSTTTAAPTTSVAPGGGPTTTVDLRPRPGATGRDTGTGAASGGPFGWMALALAIVVGVMTSARLVWMRHRGRAPAGASPDERVRWVWARATRDLRVVGLDVEPGESPIAFARRAAPTGGDALVDLGRAESDRRYRPTALDEGDATRAEAAAADVATRVAATLTRAGRARFALGIGR